MRWRYYLWFNIVFVFISIVSVLGVAILPLSILSTLPPDFAMDTNILSNPADLLLMLLEIVALAGLYSYVYGKRLFSAQFWKILFFVNLAIVIVGLVQTQINAFGGRGNFDLTSILLLQIGSFIYRLPMLYALYQIGNNRFFKQKKK